MSSATVASSAPASAQAAPKLPKGVSPYAPPNQLFTGDITKTVPTVNDGAPKGRNVSGRSWKTRQQKRASSLVTQTKANNRSSSWEKKTEERKARKAVMERQKEMKEEKRQAAIAKKERRLENERRRAENEFKNAQKGSQRLGKNADLKMKAMNKKQLRQIKKTRMNVKTGAVEYVSPYAK
mmetsp:Transcript_102/g.174  ORF Transcript_102/g.174 Transcript_102/m.174 type:complete len:181 (-) Transcript_102:372-914(-)|eukprot:CAMPEP_0113560310 /NCGR_PEP_ID=MMETSP0015_2-20120614/19362_1 /TAXON_ID=2838 /ORGANISM="Odontella" /LENGTH=180 /DNA_ID=CAMNT_0000462005 /DNA_START=146 /DNA_END=688 /DNA_ORIENTATION=- /assembly_acc=CAM_ASM_000160